MGLFRAIGRAIAGSEKADEFEATFDRMTGDRSEEETDAVLGSVLAGAVVVADVRRRMKARRELFEAATREKGPVFDARGATNGHQVVVSVDPSDVGDVIPTDRGVAIQIGEQFYEQRLGYRPAQAEAIADDWPAVVRVYEEAPAEVADLEAAEEIEVEDVEDVDGVDDAGDAGGVGDVGDEEDPADAE